LAGWQVSNLSQMRHVRQPICLPLASASYPWGMALSITVDTTGLEEAARRSRVLAKQLPFAASLALNEVAFKARTALNGSTRQYFNAPTKFTETAFLVQKSKKADLQAIVFANNQDGRNRARYLRYGIQGGQRVAKGFERFFAGADNDGTLPPGVTLLPTSLVKTTAQGNVSIATLRSISKGLSTTNKRGGFFVGTPRGGDRPPGIYRRSRDQLFPYFVAASSAPRYTGRFPIQDVGSKVINRNWVTQLEAALERALSTAK